MNSRLQKQAKRVVKFHLDDCGQIICHRDGTMTFKWHYFYTHGKNPQVHASDVLAALDDGLFETDLAGVRLLECSDDRQAYPRDSHFVVKLLPLGTWPEGFTKEARHGLRDGDRGLTVLCPHCERSGYVPYGAYLKRCPCGEDYKVNAHRDSALD